MARERAGKSNKQTKRNARGAAAKDADVLAFEKRVSDATGLVVSIDHRAATTHRRSAVLHRDTIMAKKKSKSESDSGKAEKLGRKDYEEEIERLHGELVHLQQWVVKEGLKVCIVFEGRDGAGNRRS